MLNFLDIWECAFKEGVQNMNVLLYFFASNRSLNII